MPEPGSRPNLDPQRQWRFFPVGGGQRRGGGWVAGRERLRDAAAGCGCGCRPAPHAVSHLGRPGGRWLAPWERRSPYHTPARLPGNWD